MTTPDRPARKRENTASSSYKQHLIDTIKLPSSLRKLSAFLPKPNYEGRSRSTNALTPSKISAFNDGCGSCFESPKKKK